MCRYLHWGKNPGPAMESESPESRGKPRRTQSGKPSGGGDKFPAGCDSFDETFRRPPQNASEAAPGDCGWEHFPPRVSLRAISTWPWSERWSAKENTRPTWRKPLLLRAAQRGIEPRRTARTSEQTRCKSKVWTRKQESQSARRCPEQLCPCPCRVPSRDFGLCSRPQQWHRQPGCRPPVRVHLAS